MTGDPHTPTPSRLNALLSHWSKSGLNPSLSMLQTSEREKALKTFGGNVRRERTSHRISQEKLAKLAQLNVRTIVKIEAGELNIRTETIERIQRAIGCALSRLVDSNASEIVKIAARERKVARQKHPLAGSQIVACAFNNLNRGSSA
jgi:transcriptional regulator with XRE-family HTH domain